MDNVRLQRLVEYTYGDNLELHYIKCICYLMCDVLSRQTINMHTLREDYEFLGEAKTINAVEAVRLNTEVNKDPLVVALAIEGASDPTEKNSF